MTTVLLSPTYFGPIEWWRQLLCYDSAVIDHTVPYRKQTYRNRCIIATANGPQALTVPVTTGPAPLVSDHGNWRHVHWQALVSAYSDSPFFEYYADDLQPFFTDRWERLYDFDADITRTLCRLLDISPSLTFSSETIRPVSSNETVSSTASSPVDLRFAISPKQQSTAIGFVPRPYYQVYAQRLGFLPNLSILDLLFNMGPEAQLYLYS